MQICPAPLKSFLKVLPKGYKYAIEFRNKTWLTKDIITLLKKQNIAFCIYDLNGFETPFYVTSNFVYIRLHGPKRGHPGFHI